jgi:hypothetical protein
MNTPNEQPRAIVSRFLVSLNQRAHSAADGHGGAYFQDLLQQVVVRVARNNTRSNWYLGGRLISYSDLTEAGRAAIAGVKP